VPGGGAGGATGRHPTLLPTCAPAAGGGGSRMAMPTDIEIVDLGIGFPYTSVEQKKATYDFFRANLKDQESLREMEFPAQYMFKGVPDIVPEGTDVVQWVVDKMDEFGIRLAKVGLSPNGRRSATPTGSCSASR
jgi:hypothetical protein